MVKTRSENGQREEECGKEEEREGRRAGNTEGMETRYQLRTYSGGRRVLKSNNNQRATDQVVLPVHKHMLTHIRIGRKWVLGGGRLSHIERGKVKPSVPVLVTRRPQIPPALHPAELLWEP